MSRPGPRSGPVRDTPWFRLLAAGVGVVLGWFLVVAVHVVAGGLPAALAWLSWAVPGAFGLLGLWRPERCLALLGTIWRALSGVVR